MNKEEIRQKYLDSIQEDLEKAESYANNVNFDNLVHVCESSYGYDLFYPLKFVRGFDQICELYSRFYHDIEDDGDSSFVCAELSRVIDFAGLKEPKIKSYYRCFVMAGHRTDPSFSDEVFKYATYHESDKPSLLGFSAMRLDWDVIDFFKSLCDEFEEIDDIGKFGWDHNYDVIYFNRQELMTQKFKTYIESNNMCYKWSKK
jgi:hypothetical protein